MMRNRWFVLGVFMLSLAFLATVSLAGNGKVTLCHVRGNSGKVTTISVAAPAVAAHLAHGDSLGSCEMGAGTSRFRKGDKFFFYSSARIPRASEDVLFEPLRDACKNAHAK